MDSRFDVLALLDALAAGGVEFVVVGGVAAFAQGAPITTLDLDIVHRRTPENVARLVAVLQALDAGDRWRPDLRPGADALLGAGHHLLVTKFGPLDVLGAIDPDLTYDDLRSSVVTATFRGHEAFLLGLDRLVELKRTSTRPKDRAMLPVLEETLRRTSR